MKIKILASGSTGNSAILQDEDGTQIILDCGIRFDKLCVELNWDKSIVCLISHKHGDHYNPKSIEKLQKFGITVLSEDNFIKSPRFKVNGFNIVATRLPHANDCSSWAFIMYNTVEKKSFFFATDCTELPNIADTTIDLMMIENNYDKKTVFYNASKGKISNLGYLNHLSTEYILSWFQRRKNMPKNLILSHLSNSGNLDLGSLRRVYQSYADNIFIARENLTVEF